MITLLSYFFAGYAVLFYSRGRIPSPGAAFALGMALAIFLGFFSVLLFGGLVPLWIILAVSAVPAFIGAWNRREQIRSWKFPPAPANQVDRLYRLAMILILIGGLFVLIRLVGISVQNFDLLSYHLPLAESLATTGEARQVLLQPEIFYARMPLGAPIAQAPLVRNDWQAGFGIGFHLFSAISILAGAVSCARVAAWFGARAFGMLLAAGFYLFHSLMMNSLANGVYDPAVGLMAMAGAELTLQGYSRRGSRLHLVLAGAVAATAGIVKFSAMGTALVPVGIIALAGILRFRNGTPWAIRVRPIISFAIGAVVVLSPWLARAVYLGGHPFFPFAGSSESWLAEQGRFVVEQHRPLSVFSLAYWTDFFAKGKTFGYGLIVPAVPGLVVAALIGIFRKRSVGPFVVAGGVGYLAWLTVQLNPARFLIPAAVLFIPPAVIGISRLFRSPENRRFAELAAIGLLLLNAWPYMIDAYNLNPVYARSSRESAMDVLGPQMTVVRYAQDDTMDHGTLLLFFETRKGLFQPDTEARTVWDQPSWAPLLKEADTPEEFERLLLREGHSGIYSNEFEWGRLVQFYARDQIKPQTRAENQMLQNNSLMGLLGIQSPLAEQGLRAYPPYRFAGFTDRDLTVLLDFLRSKRDEAQAVAEQSPFADAWYARLEE